jgi:hypothetical protein
MAPKGGPNADARDQEGLEMKKLLIAACVLAVTALPAAAAPGDRLRDMFGGMWGGGDANGCAVMLVAEGYECVMVDGLPVVRKIGADTPVLGSRWAPGTLRDRWCEFLGREDDCGAGLLNR